MSRPIASPFDLRRSLFACLVAATAAVVLGAGLGFGAASQGKSEAMREIAPIGIPLPNVGDQGRYDVEWFSDGSNPEAISQPLRPSYEFEWLEDRQGFDEAGQPVFQNAYRFEYLSQEPFGPEPGTSWSSVSHSVLAHNALDARLVSITQVGVEGGDQTYDGTLFTTQRRDSGSSTVTHFIAPDDIGFEAPCEVRNGLQGQTISLGQQLVLFQNCTGEGYWARSAVFEATQLGQVDGRRAVILSKVSDPWEPTIPVRSAPPANVTLLFIEGLPYPAKISVESVWRPGETYVTTLVGFEEGEVPIRAEPPQIAPPPALEFQPRQLWGLDDSGMVHPFLPSAAFGWARDHPQESGLRDFVASHPDAYAEIVSYDESTQNRAVFRHWGFQLTDGKERLVVGVTQRHGPTPQGFDPLLPSEFEWPNYETTYSFNNYTASHGPRFPFRPLPPDRVPSLYPTAASLVQRWAAYAGSDAGVETANGWGFEIQCYGFEDRITEECDHEYALRFYAGSADTKESQDFLPQSSYSFERRTSEITVDAQGRTLQLEQRQSSSEFSTSPTSPGSPPSGGGPPEFQTQTLKFDRWQIPRGEYAAATGVVAILAGLGYWLWPTLKNAIAFPFFSRVERPKALEQPVRAEIARLIESEPGIHREEITRRTGHGRGTVEHHLRKLAETGIVTAQATPHYTCYFPTGRVDRRVAAALPTLKAEGPRRLLAAALSTPAISLREAARASGMSRQGAHQQTARLAAAGLIEVDVVNRESRIRPTDIARPALELSSAS